eukprot:CAMPEP_0202072234 /NCGR_PEP_ID=MMETSP0964-20121228/2303_1 /ASSEMBLY_ACC=CAM_ASM_000500 /TAXON_ID=4773 /ORGANISM="Schizochytrium aggregatum, Strain ATCC28209" /LENGTH=83 /DNA_ID=CAMNT_0048639255 /DNA_START=162 /DNA_END=410 /DNA_ORIENTATION=-
MRLALLLTSRAAGSVPLLGEAKVAQELGVDALLGLEALLLRALKAPVAVSLVALVAVGVVLLLDHLDERRVAAQPSLRQEVEP